LNKHLLINSNIQEFEFIKKNIDSIQNRYSVSSDKIREIEIASEEIFSNICIHSYNSVTDKPIEIYIDYFDNNIEITFFDWGLTNKNLVIPGNLSAVKENHTGIGLFLVNKYCDDFKYNFNGQHNVTIIKKRCIDMEE